MAYDSQSLMKMSGPELDALFSASPPGDIPNGEGKGTAIIAPGTTYTVAIAQLINSFAWQGKIFDAEKGVLKKLILPFGLSAVIAKIYKGTSWFDEKECIVLDYSETSLVAHWIRDEIRLIQPRTYLGKVYWERSRLFHFLLEF